VHEACVFQLQAASTPEEVQAARQDLHHIIGLSGCTGMCINIVPHKADLVESLTRFLVLGRASEAYQQ
jgi:hypothetical protein